MPREWDLDDLAAIGDLASERGVGASAATNWRRYNDFPKPLVILSTGPIYSRAQIRAWQEARWPPGTPGSGRVHFVGEPPRPRGSDERADETRAARGRSRRWSYDHITADLRDRIRSGEWPPGGRLPARPALAEQYGVSERLMARPIADLCRERLLETRAASGTYVTQRREEGSP